MAQFVPMSGGGGVQVVPQGRSGVVEQIALLNALSGAAQTGIGAYRDYQQRSKQEAADKALAQALMGDGTWNNPTPMHQRLSGADATPGASPGPRPGGAGPSPSELLASGGVWSNPTPMHQRLSGADPAPGSGPRPASGGPSPQQLAAGGGVWTNPTPLHQRLAAGPGSGAGPLTPSAAMVQALAPGGAGAAPRVPATGGGMSEDQLRAIMLQPGGREALTQAYLQRKGLAGAKEGFTLGEGEIRYDASGRPIAVGAPATPDISSAAKEARDLGFDLATPEGRAAYGQYRQSLTREPKGTTVNVGADKPVGASAGILSLITGAEEDIQDVTASIIDPETGEINRQNISTMNIPLVGGGVPGTAGGSELRGKVMSVVDQMLTMRTGASYTEAQIEAASDSYLPNATDSDDAVVEKMRRLARDFERAKRIYLIGQPGAQEVIDSLPKREPKQATPGMIDELISEGLGYLQKAGQGEAPAPPEAAQPKQSFDAVREERDALDYGEGDIWRNPKTGESVILRGGQWVPWNG